MTGITEGDYLGVVVRESLRHTRRCDAQVIGSEPTQSWTLLLLRVPPNELEASVDVVRTDLDDGPWYTHYFRGEDLVIVYADGVFHVRSRTPATWADAIAHGRRRGIPDEQLDFEPRTLRDATRESNVEAY